MYELSKYPHSINSDGDMVVKDVPVFAENIRVTENGEPLVFDEAWIREAVKEGFSRYVLDNFQYPWHENHHTKQIKELGIKLRVIGRFIPTRVEYRPIKGEMKACAICDLIINQDCIEEAMANKWPYLSVEVIDPKIPEFSSLAGLSTRIPEHQFANFSISPVMFSRQGEGDSLIFQFNEDLPMFPTEDIQQQNYGSASDLASKIANNWGRVKAKIYASPKYASLMGAIKSDLDAGTGPRGGWLAPENIAGYVNPSPGSDIIKKSIFNALSKFSIDDISNLAQYLFQEEESKDAQNFGIVGDLTKKIKGWMLSKPDEAVNPQKNNAWSQINDQTKFALRKLASLAQSGRVDENQIDQILQSFPGGVHAQLRHFAGNYGAIFEKENDMGPQNFALAPRSVILNDGSEYQLRMNGDYTSPKGGGTSYTIDEVNKMIETGKAKAGNNQGFEKDENPMDTPNPDPQQNMEGEEGGVKEKLIDLLEGFTPEQIQRLLDQAQNLSTPEPSMSLQTEGPAAFSKEALKDIFQTFAKQVKADILAEVSPVIDVYKKSEFENKIRERLGRKLTDANMEQVQVFAKKHGKTAALDYAEIIGGQVTPRTFGENLNTPIFNSSKEEEEVVQTFSKQGMAPDAVRHLIGEYNSSVLKASGKMTLKRFIEVRSPGFKAGDESKKEWKMPG